MTQEKFLDTLEKSLKRVIIGFTVSITFVGIFVGLIFSLIKAAPYIPEILAGIAVTLFCYWVGFQLEEW